MKLFHIIVLFSCKLCIESMSTDRSHVIKNRKHHKNKKILTGVFLNTWAVVVHGDADMAKRVATDNGFINTGKVFGNVYEFVHRGVQKRRKRASFVKTMHLNMDTRVVWTQQQESKIRRKRSIDFNDPMLKDQWYLHQTDPGFEGHDMNVLPVWEKGITGKGIVVSILDDGIEYTHPELKDNYDPKASYDYNNNDTDPMPRYTWRADNRHGTRCAGEIAAAANNSNCIVGVAYGASIGGIKMLDGEITDMVEARSLQHARDHIDIYSSSWGPQDDGDIVDGPGTLTKKALRDGAKLGRQGKGSIIVWASGNGGANNDHCNCDGYTNSIYTISVSAATSAGLQPWYLESCASTLVTAYSSGSSKTDKDIVTSDLNDACTSDHSGTSVSPPLVAGFIALALEVNPNLTWRDVQHLLVETSSSENLIGGFHINGAGKKYSHHFGFGVVNGAKLVSLAETWPTVSEQRKCHHWKKIQQFPFNRFNKSSPLIIEINSTACKGAPQHIKYVEHVHIHTTLYHFRRGATEILIVSPMQTSSWVLRERDRDIRGGEFSKWDFLSTHFWGENPTGTWKVIFFSKERDEYGQGFLQEMTLVLYGTEQKPGVRHKDDPIKKPYKCHVECKMGCAGPENYQCKKCQHYSYTTNVTIAYCVAKCPPNTFTIEKSMLCLPCHPTCLTCTNANRTHCLSCPSTSALDSGSCVTKCPANKFKQVHPYNSDSYVCQECSKQCTSCFGNSENCSSCDHDSILQGNACIPKCASNQWLNGEICHICHLTCKTCNGGTELNCTMCPKKILNDVEDRYLFKGQKCLTDCPLGTYKDNTIKQSCLDCSPNCLQCSNEGRKCNKCEVSYFRVESGDGQCVKKCPLGYYADLVRRVCEACHPQCDSCVPGKPSSCTVCSKGYFLKDYECVAKSECNTRSYVNETSGKCLFCPAKCTTCKSADLCVGCSFNYFHTSSDKCEEKCPSGTFPHDRTSECEECHETCAECEGSSSYDCIACEKGMSLHNGVCKTDIPIGFYSQTVGSTSILRQCHHTCKSCSGPGLKDCLICIDSLDKRSNGCINPCPGQYLSENNCQNCHPSCKECYGPSASQCLECHSNFSLNIDTYTCNKACHRKFYKDVKTFTCKPCHQSCSTCFGPNATHCLTCPDKLHFHNNTCVWQCPSGWFKAFGQACAPCSSRCKQCLFKYDFCTNCSDDEVTNDDYKCYKDCGKGKFQDSSRRCLACDESCINCNGTAPNECTECEPGMTLHDGMCLPGCLVGFYNNTMEKKCVPCMKDCLKCEEFHNDSQTCLVCSNSTVLMPNGQCGETCPSSSYLLPTDNRCVLCPGRGCDKCTKHLGKSCSSCKPLYELSNGLCKSTCGLGKYPDESTKCTKCHSLCFSCDGPTEKDCKRCSQRAVMLISPTKKISCLSTCPPSFYNKNNICTKCESPCLNCISQKKCSSCHKPSVLHKYKCIKTCPRGYYLNEQDSSCYSCRDAFGPCSLCNSTACSQCKTGSYLLDSMCRQDCGGRTHIKRNGQCVPCGSIHANCMECNTTTCDICNPGFHSVNNICTLKCNLSYQLINGTCIQCKNPNCTEYTLSTDLESDSKETLPTEESWSYTTPVAPLTQGADQLDAHYTLSLPTITTNLHQTQEGSGSDTFTEEGDLVQNDDEIDSEGGEESSVNINKERPTNAMYGTRKSSITKKDYTYTGTKSPSGTIKIPTSSSSSSSPSAKEINPMQYDLVETETDRSIDEDANVTLQNTTETVLIIKSNKQPKRSKRSVEDSYYRDGLEDNISNDDGESSTSPLLSTYLLPFGILLILCILAAVVWQARFLQISKRRKTSVTLSYGAEAKWIYRRSPTIECK